MRYRTGSYLLSLTLLFNACAGSRTSVSSSDYNAYDEDLKSVRPVYTTTSAPSGNAGARPVPVPTNPAASTKKPENRRLSGPVEALHVNRRLESVLDTIADKNRSVRYAPGFRVQVYVGTQRQEVESAKLLISQNFPELSPYLSYNQPTYKLKVGDFMRRMDADRYYTSIRQLIPSAQLQPDKVDIRRSLLIK